ncbi:unnamed protein product [Symbiodinium sp. CCMP2592]|nr:unnamed protein product [Symbiodinium sp. CCMP2592]
MMQKLGAEDFREQCMHLANLCLQTTRQVEEILVADGVPTAIVSEEPGGDFYILESGTEAESGAITAPTRTADLRDAFVDSATHAEPREVLVEDPSVFLQEPREGQLVARRQSLESQLQQMRAEQAGLSLAETLHKLGSALLDENETCQEREESQIHDEREAQDARQALEYLHQSLQIKSCLHEGADGLSIAQTLYELGRASSILNFPEQAKRYFLDSYMMIRHLHRGDREVLVTLYRLGNEHFLSRDFREAKIVLELALSLAEGLWPGYLDGSDEYDSDPSKAQDRGHRPQVCKQCARSA